MGLSLLLSLCLPPLLTVPTDGRPMRFGFSVPAVALERGLALGGRGAMQWRRLPVGPADAENVWIEIAIVAPRGTVRILRGGAGPCPDGRGPAFVLSRDEQRVAHGTVRVMRWQWVDGTVDQRSRTTFTATTELAGEVYQVGEGLTTQTEGLSERAMHWLRRGRDPAVRCGLLPSRARGLSASKNVRRHLHKVLPRLVEMGGRRGAGDFVRQDGVVTNLEFDTTLALLRCAVAMQEPRAWQLALRAAGHLRDRDLDMRTGLPFVHGVSHRGVAPEPGHTWLEGILWVGLLTADDDALVTVRSIGRALAAHLPMGTGRQERLRDYAWPLLQLECLLRVDPVKQLTVAADRLAASIQLRFDVQARTFRFGEGELGGGVYLERGWLTAGILIPALRSHLLRHPDAALAAKVCVVQQSLLDRIGSGARGLPTHWRIADGRVSAEHYERNTARASWLLEALSPRDQSRLLRRSSVRRAVDETPALEHPDLATEFTLLARCRWVWR
ncbi:MAG: hypothetical protein ACI89X_002320 [Planctomycetota bacterium]|jgi:hypothetical protein